MDGFLDITELPKLNKDEVSNLYGPITTSHWSC